MAQPRKRLPRPPSGTSGTSEPQDTARDEPQETVNTAYPNAQPSHYHLRGTIPPDAASYPIPIIPQGLPPTQIRGTEPPDRSFGVAARHTIPFQRAWLTEDSHMVFRQPCQRCGGTGEARVLVAQCPHCYRWFTRKQVERDGRILRRASTNAAPGRAVKAMKAIRRSAAPQMEVELPCGDIIQGRPMYVHPPCKGCYQSTVGRGYEPLYVEVRDLFNLMMQAFGIPPSVLAQYRIPFYERQVEQIREQSGITAQQAFRLNERITPHLNALAQREREERQWEED